MSRWFDSRLSFAKQKKIRNINKLTAKRESTRRGYKFDPITTSIIDRQKYRCISTNFPIFIRGSMKSLANIFRETMKGGVILLNH